MSRAADILEIPATITERGQTTVPVAIRTILKLGKRDHVVFRALADGTVVIARREEANLGLDPVLGAFLSFVARDMNEHPDRIRPVSPGVVARGTAMVVGIEVDLDAKLTDDDV